MHAPTLDSIPAYPAAIPVSAEARHLKRSVMRDLLALAASPDMLSLAGGLPCSDSLPTEDLRACLSDVLLTDGGRALQYSPPHMPLRAWIAEAMRGRGIDCTPEQVFLTNGNQHGLTILSRLLLDPGAPAILEDATFTGIQQITAGRGAEVIAVPTDPDSGVDLAALERAFARSPRPRFAVLIPDFHNPLGVSLTSDARQRIAALSARYGVPIIEDDPYSALRFAGEPIAPIKAFDEADTVFYLGSFSKMLAPALRLGWLIAPPDLLPRITAVRESIDLESSTLIQRAVFRYLESGALPAHLDQLNAVNRARCAALHDALTLHLSDIASWNHPEGGLFIWLTLPDSIDTWRMFDAATDQGVIYIPGAAFSITGAHRNAMRLNFSSLPPDALHEAVRRLSGVIRAAL